MKRSPRTAVRFPPHCFGQSATAGQTEQVYPADLGGLQNGRAFLPPDPERLDKTGFQALVRDRSSQMFGKQVGGIIEGLGKQSLRLMPWTGRDTAPIIDDLLRAAGLANNLRSSFPIGPDALGSGRLTEGRKCRKKCFPRTHRAPMRQPAECDYFRSFRKTFACSSSTKLDQPRRRSS